MVVVFGTCPVILSVFSCLFNHKAGVEKELGTHLIFESMGKGKHF